MSRVFSETLFKVKPLALTYTTFKPLNLNCIVYYLIYGFYAIFTLFQLMNYLVRVAMYNGKRKKSSRKILLALAFQRHFFKQTVVLKN